MPRIHLLNQYIWPDAAPTGVYAEQLGSELVRRGQSAVLVGGTGSYRISARPQPLVPIREIPHSVGKRGNHVSVFREYHIVAEAFRSYIEKEVGPGEIVVITSAPPTTLSLATTIRKKGAISVYWLQDYYPELLRGVVDYPKIFRNMLGQYWKHQLLKWDHVVKVAGNLGGDVPGVRTLRNWPTLRFIEPLPAPIPGTALYSGNLGYGHDIKLFVEACAELVRQNYQVKIVADGPGVKKLPAWLCPQPAFQSEQELSMALQLSEVHLVAAHPRIQHAVFPSKIWNSLALNRRIVTSGFTGEMLAELEWVQKSDFHKNLHSWCDFLISLAK